MWRAPVVLIFMLACARQALAEESSKPPTARFEDVVAPSAPRPVTPVPDGNAAERPWVLVPAPTPDHSAVSPPNPASTEESWYGWQTLLTDGVALAMLLAGGGSPVAGVGGFTFFLGGPVIHGAHGHAGKALGSLGLRVGLPLTGVLIAAAGSEDCEDLCGYGRALENIALGLLIGAGAAITLDAAVLAREEVPARGRDRVPRRGMRITPNLAISPEGFSAGIGGTF